jgi:hypothetical protein
MTAILASRFYEARRRRFPDGRRLYFETLEVDGESGGGVREGEQWTSNRSYRSIRSLNKASPS